MRIILHYSKVTYVDIIHSLRVPVGVQDNGGTTAAIHAIHGEDDLIANDETHFPDRMVGWLSRRRR